MPEINYIKHLRETEDLSITDIARKLGINWRTAKKYADGEVPLPSTPGKRRGMMYTEVFGQIVDIWLEEDALEKRKDRRNNKGIFEQLRDEHGFSGSYRTICDYIQRRKPELKYQRQTRFERLEHPQGEAQVDFGTMRAVRDGGYQSVKALILSFPYSNAGFGYPMPAENSECFLEGLQRLFHQAGGVPQQLRIDNLTAAVLSVGKGEKRTYTDAFLAFQAHYGFGVQPCNPASGHEKGNVEKKVGYTRSNLFVVAPVMKDFDQLACWMEKGMKADRARLHYEKGVTIESLWKEEKTYLKKQPLNDYPVYQFDQATTNKYGEIIIDREPMRIPYTRPRQTLLIKKTWDQFTCITDEGEVIYEANRPYMGKTQPIPWLDILGGWRHKPRAVTYSRYFRYLPTPIQIYLKHHPEEVKARVKGLLTLLEKNYTFKQIAALLEMPGRLNAEPHELLALLESRKFSPPEKLEETHTPETLIDYEMNLDHYDQMLYRPLAGMTE